MKALRRTSWTVFLLGICLCMITRLVPAQTPEEQAWSIIQSATEDKSKEKRARGAFVLGLVSSNPRAGAIAQKALEDEQPEVRAAAATALGNMRDKQAIAKLKDRLEDKDFVVALSSAHSLCQLKDPAGYEFYYGILTGERKPGDGLLEKQRKTMQDPKKLAHVGFQRGLGFVRFADIGSETFHSLKGVDPAAMRAIAAEILADDPGPAVDALVKGVSDKSWMVRASALTVIARRGDPVVISRILPALQDENDVARFTAAATVIHLSDLSKGVNQGTRR